MNMKKIAILAVLPLAGCVSIELPGLVSDAVKASKDLYKSAAGDKPEAPPARRVFAHSYIGSESQTVAEMKQACVKEAEQKLAQALGKEPRYTVVENEVVTWDGKVMATCKLALGE